jgi:hypothetical protein
MMHRMIGRYLIVGLALAAFGFDAMAQYSATNRRAAARGAEQSDTKQALFEIDRRPVVMLQVWNATYGAGNSWGVGVRYRGNDAGEQIVRELDRLYDQGWRRIMLLTPTGGPRYAMLNKTYGEWYARPRPWQQNMTTHISQWKQSHPDATLGVYLGIMHRDGSLPLEREFERYLGPWLNMGITEFGFDNSALVELRDIFFSIDAWLKERGARAVMEAYGRVSGRELDYSVVGTVPAMALRTYVDYVDPTRKLSFDPEMTEMWIGIGRGEPIDPDEVRSLRDRGFVILIYNPQMEQRAAALDALGLLASPQNDQNAQQSPEYTPDDQINEAQPRQKRRRLR